MFPIFFGDETYKLFGVYHSPENFSSQSQNILLCTSLGHEYIRSYYLMRQIAEKLSSNGHHVLRFDWYGCGDSSGNIHDSSTEIWNNNIQLAIDELLDLSRGEKVSLVGLRIAAPMLIEFVKSIKSSNNIDSIVFFDPVFSGDEWLKSISVVHNSMLEILPCKRKIQSKPGEILGFIFPKELQDSIQKITCANEQLTGSIPIHAIISDSYCGISNPFSNIQTNRIITIESTGHLWNDSRIADRIIMSHPGTVPLCTYFKEHSI